MGKVFGFNKPDYNSTLAYINFQTINYTTLSPYILNAATKIQRKRLSRSRPTKKLNEHPRKKLLEDAPMHTQRAWLYSSVIPGLGQIYNENYWKLSLIYGIFAGLTWGAIYNHNEYTTTRREYIVDNKNQNLLNYMKGRKRDRNLFIAVASMWYFINIFDAYVGGTLKTFDVSDDLEVIIQSPKDITDKPSVGVNISLQLKDENRHHRIRKNGQSY